MTTLRMLGSGEEGVGHKSVPGNSSKKMLRHRTKLTTVLMLSYFVVFLQKKKHVRFSKSWKTPCAIFLTFQKV